MSSMPRTNRSSRSLSSSRWTTLIDFDALVQRGTIRKEDANSFEVVDSVEEAWAVLARTGPMMKTALREP